MYPNNAEAYPKSAPQAPPPYPPQAPPQYPPGLPNQAPNGAVLQQWTTGICSCFDDPSNCFITWCCPCITFGQIAEIVDRGNTSCAIAGIIYYALASVGCACLYTCTFRSKLRTTHSLAEDPCADFLVHWCCPACALCQEYRELKNRGVDPSIGWQANVERWKQGGMKVAPNVLPGMTR